MKKWSLILKLLIFTGTPVLAVFCAGVVFPHAPTFAILIFAILVALGMARLLQNLIRREIESLVNDSGQLKDELASGKGSLSLEQAEGTTLLAEPRQALQDLAHASQVRIATLLASNDELSRRYSQFQLMLATMVEGVLLIESEGRVLYCNRSAGRLLDREPSEIERRQLWEVIRTPGLEAAIERAMLTGEELREEFELQRTHRIVEMNAIQVDVESGSGMVIVFHDISELRRLERMRREFVSNVSHELKTPLTAIQAFSDTLLDGGLEDRENSRQFVEQIQEQSDRLQKLIQDMLRLARIEAQADAFQLQMVSLTETVADCVNARMAVARAKNVSLTFDEEDEPSVEILADQEGLRTIFDNLINNALNYTQEEGEVHVRCWQADGHAIAEVQDNGVGISREHHTRIFERFYRVDRARSRGMGGTGLGLAIVKHCVNVFQGEIEIDSEVGRGTTFRVSFPLVKSKLQSTPVSQ